MDNRILQIDVRDHSLVPAEAEICIHATPERQTPTTELRGRLMGPSCVYAETVEVAYPLRTLPAGRGDDAPGIVRRVVVPEACLWEPECPFLYRGAIELWQDGQCCDRVVLSHGLRSFRLGSDGLCVNGHKLRLHGRDVADCTESDALALHRAGYNLLVAPVADSTLPLWEQADRLGFLMLGRVPDDNESTRRRMELLSCHASCLGWLVSDEEHPLFRQYPRSELLGLACASPSSEESMSRADFVFTLRAWTNLGKPLLIKGEVPSERPKSVELLGNVE